MGVFAGPDLKEDGLVLALDGANKKTFANSVINSTSWSLGSGSVTGYSQNGATAENERVTGTDPFGKSATVWETRPQGNNADDGGWNSDWFNIDSTKLYRFSVWVKRTTDTSGGIFYLGLYGNNGIKRTDNSVVEGNPYWDCRVTSGFEKDVWYLVMGHCYPYNTTYTGQHPESGIYTVAGGTTKVASINACNIGADVKWAGVDVTQTIHRCYHYYCADSTTRLQLFDPRIDVIDGTEPSIRNLLSGFTASRLTDLIGTNNGTFVNGPTYSSANGGSLVFDGVDDYIINSSTTNIPTGSSSRTIQLWVYLKSDTNTFVQLGTGGGGNQVYIVQFYNIGGTRYLFTDGVNGANNLTISVSQLPILNIWNHIIFGNSGQNWFYYLNGVSQASGTFGVTLNTIGQKYIIGKRDDYLPTPGNINGNIAQVSIYNRALSAAEIQQNYNALKSRFVIPSIVTDGLVLNLDAGNTNSYPGSGTTWTDLSGNGNTGTLTNGPTYSSANSGSIVFDGANDYVQKSSATINLSAGVTMEMMFKSTDMNSRAQGFMQFNTGGNYINFYTPGNGFLRWETWVPVGVAGGAYTTPTALSNNTWYHAVGTYSNGSSVLYINGNIVASASQTSGTYSSSYTGNIVIGEYAGYMSGNIAQASIYNRALSAAEIQQNFNALRGRFGI